MILRAALLSILILLKASPAFSVNVEPWDNSALYDPATGLRASVELNDGKNKLHTLAQVTVEQLFGRDNQATVWFYIGTAEDAAGVGSAGDVVNIQMPVGVIPSLFPASNVSVTVTSAHTSATDKEKALADSIVSALNADSNFSTAWKAARVKDFTGVFINSKFFNEWGERTSWTATATGTTVVTKAFTDVVRRGFATELSRSPNNPRSGILAIAGQVSTVPGTIGQRYGSYFLNAGSSDLRVNGSTTAVTFSVTTSAVYDTFIQLFKCFGGGSGIQFGKHLSQSGTGLTNGNLVSVRSDEMTTTFEPLKKTEDYKNILATSAAEFSVDVQSGADQFIAFYKPEVPFVLRKQGTFVSGDDYLQIVVRDNLTAGLAQFQCYAEGFTREP